MSYFADDWKKWGGGQKAPLGGLKDIELHEKLKNYKKLVAKRYRVVTPDLITRYLPDGNLWISTKVDGELWFAIKREGEVALVAYNGRCIQGVPVVKELEKQLKDVKTAIIPGELFALAGKGRPRVGNVASALGDDEKAKTLGFKAFDVLECDGEDYLYKGYNERFEILEKHFKDGKRSCLVTTAVGEKSDASDYFDEWVNSEKFEGLVVRSEQGITYKIKPFVTIDCVVMAYGERQEGGRAQVRELTVALMRDDGTFHILGTVGNGFGETGRAEWHDRLSKIQMDSTFRMANREGTLCRFVKPEIIVEVKASDIVDTDSRENPVRRMALKYDEKKGWSALGTMPIVSMIHPVLLRERTDKEVDLQSVGLDQAFQHVPFAGRDEKATMKSLATSTIFKRCVYSKVTKGKTAVRKYVAFATNKHEEDPNFPPYVVIFTDFSAGRKDPLKTDIKVGSSEASLEGHIGEWITKNVKKGWEEVQ